MEKERSSRKLVRVGEKNFSVWGCSECAWVFNPTDPPVGESLEDMIRNFQQRLSEEYASHACAQTSRVNWPKKIGLWFIWASSVTGLATTNVECIQILL